MSSSWTEPKPTAKERAKTVFARWISECDDPQPLSDVIAEAIEAAEESARLNAIRECEARLRRRASEWMACYSNDPHDRVLRCRASDEARECADTIAALAGRDEA